MSRDSRQAKRDVKLKKLAAKHGKTSLPPRTLAREREIQYKSRVEMRRAMTAVSPAGGLRLTGTVQEQRAQFDAHLMAIAMETRLTIGGSRDKAALAMGFAEHLARVEHMEYVEAERSIKAREGVIHVEGKGVRQQPEP